MRLSDELMKTIYIRLASARDFICAEIIFQVDKFVCFPNNPTDRTLTCGSTRRGRAGSSRELCGNGGWWGNKSVIAEFASFGIIIDGNHPAQMPQGAEVSLK